MLETIWMYLKAFVIGGLLCTIAQVLLLKTKLSAARILVGYVTAGVLLGAVGLYQPLIEFAGAGASIPLFGFGSALAQGAIDGVKEKGLLGAFTGGLGGTAAGISAAILFGYLAAVLFKPKMKA